MTDTKQKPNDAKPQAETADEKQATQAKQLTQDERDALDKKAIAERKAAQEVFHAERIKQGIEDNKANADVLYVIGRPVKIVRKAKPDDIDYHAGEACSVVQFIDTGLEQVVQDVDIKTSPSI